MVGLRSSRLVLYPAGLHHAFAPALLLRESGPAAAPEPGLLDRVREAIRARHHSRQTEKAYVRWIKRYVLFHGKRHPAEMGAGEVTALLIAHDLHPCPEPGPAGVRSPADRLLLS